MAISKFNGIPLKLLSIKGKQHAIIVRKISYFYGYHLSFFCKKKVGAMLSSIDIIEILFNWKKETNKLKPNEDILSWNRIQLATN